MGRLYGLSYSPWTERARWALDHHGVRYSYHEHVPLLGERLLRFRARHTGSSRATVPLFIDATGSYGDSLEIIERADAIGDSHPLISDHASAVELRDRVEEALAAGRARVSAAILGDREALTESAMAASPAFLAPMLRPVAAHGARFIAQKYAADLTADHDAAMRGVLEELRQRRRGAEGFGAGGLTVEDLLVASALQCVMPVADAYIALKPATRRAWTSEPLAEEFGDLLAWRDALYARHRRADVRQRAS